jgi:biopolymer transport protein ExbB/TolQ
MLTKEQLSQVMHTIAQSLSVPSTIVLLLLIAIAVVLAGTLLAEYFTEHRRLKVKLPQLFDKLHSGEAPVDECIRCSGLLKRQRRALIEVTRHPELTDITREALAVRLITEEQDHYDRIVKISDLVAKLGPMLGLLGTLIPLGPGLIAMGQGDTYTLSMSMLVAFDSTIMGLLSAAIALVVSAIRKLHVGIGSCDGMRAGGGKRRCWEAV